MMKVLLIDYSFSKYKLIVKDDKKEELYVWKNIYNVFHKKLSKKLVNKMILWDSVLYDLRYVPDEALVRILWKYEMG